MTILDLHPKANIGGRGAASGLDAFAALQAGFAAAMLEIYLTQLKLVAAVMRALPLDESERRPDMNAELREPPRAGVAPASNVLPGSSRGAPQSQKLAYCGRTVASRKNRRVFRHLCRYRALPHQSS